MKADTLDELDAIMPAEAEVRAIRPELERGVRLTDVGNGERFALQHGQGVRFCHQWKTWLTWDNTRWRRDVTGTVTELAKETALSIYLEASREANSARRAALAKHAAQSEKDARLRAMLSMAQSDPGIAIVPDALDADPMLLNLRNGVFDLRKGVLHNHDPRLLLTKLAGSVYDGPDSECPEWLSFLTRVLHGDQELIAFVQRAVGYTLTGDTGAQCLFFLYGSGANGKSTFLDTIAMLLGDYAMEADFSTFLERKNDGAREDIARLQGARMVSAIEASDGRRWNEGLLKTLTGQDTVVARYLHQNSFEFRPQFKLWLAANHKPSVRGVDDAIWRRIMLIPFTVQIPERERRDKSLMLEAFRAELPGILRWALHGCELWLEDGLRPPTSVQDATAAYREEQDTLGVFFTEYCEIGAGFSETVSRLFEAYKRWCDEGNERAMNKNRFGRSLTERGFTPNTSGDGKHRIRMGLRLKQTRDTDAFNGRSTNSSLFPAYVGEKGKIRQDASVSLWEPDETQAHAVDA